MDVLESHRLLEACVEVRCHSGRRRLRSNANLNRKPRRAVDPIAGVGHFVVSAGVVRACEVVVEHVLLGVATRVHELSMEGCFEHGLLGVECGGFSTAMFVCC